MKRFGYPLVSSVGAAMLLEDSSSAESVFSSGYTIKPQNYRLTMKLWDKVIIFASSSEVYRLEWTCLRHTQWNTTWRTDRISRRKLYITPKSVPLRFVLFGTLRGLIIQPTRDISLLSHWQAFWISYVQNNQWTKRWRRLMYVLQTHLLRMCLILI